MNITSALFDSRGGLGFRVKLFNEDITEIEGLRGVAMATNFGTKIAITGLCHCVTDNGDCLWIGFEWSMVTMTKQNCTMPACQVSS